MKYRDFSEMPPDALRAFANALAEAGRKAQAKEDRKRKTSPLPRQDGGGAS